MFDRGHMAPAADFEPGSPQRAASFSMANISPQHRELNRGWWAGLEAWTRQLLAGPFQELLVVTGPVFAPTALDGQWLQLHRTLGRFPRLVTVPSHFFKVVVAVRAGSEELAVAAFLVPNAAVAREVCPLCCVCCA